MHSPINHHRSRPILCDRADVVAIRGYAEALYTYADDRLDIHDLHAWLIQRVMTDGGINHEASRGIADDVFRDHIHRENAAIENPRSADGAHLVPSKLPRMRSGFSLPALERIIVKPHHTAPLQ